MAVEWLYKSGAGKYDRGALKSDRGYINENPTGSGFHHRPKESDEDWANAIINVLATGESTRRARIKAKGYLQNIRDPQIREEMEREIAKYPLT